MLDPSHFPELEVRKKLSRSMTDVYLVWHRERQCEAVLKVVERGTDESSVLAVEAERRGAELQREAAARNPSHIVQVYDFGDRGPYFFVLLEYVRGESLESRLKRGPIPEAEAIQIAVDLLDTLETLHAFSVEAEPHPKAVVHGDLKPANVVIREDGAPRLVDYGIARSISRTRQATRSAFATYEYCSPERLQSWEVSRADDLWAVGVILHEMAAGAQPFWAPDESKLRQLISAGPAPPPLPSRISPGLRAIAAKALASQPESRYQTAREFLDDLKQVQAGAEPRASSETRPAPKPAAAPTRKIDRPSLALKAKSPPATWSRRFVPGLLVIAAGLFVLHEVNLYEETTPLRQTNFLAKSDEQVKQERERFLKLVGQSWLPRGAAPVVFMQSAMRARLVDTALQITREVRRPDATTSEKDWTKCVACIQYAQEIRTADGQMEGIRQFCEGQIDRINGQVRKGNERDALLQNALRKFERAASLLPAAPEPYLAMARIYAATVPDPERLIEVLEQAAKRGFTPGSRETAQQADALVARSRRFRAEAASFDGVSVPEKRRYLERALDDLNQAIELYESIPSFSGVSRNLRTAIQFRKLVEEDIARLPAEGAWG